MGRGLRVGRVLGIEIRLDPSWFLVFCLIAWTLSVGVFPSRGFRAAEGWALGITAALLLSASVLAHEVSHAVIARRYGLEVRGITLFLFGGVAQIRNEPPSPRAEFFIAGVGPAVSLLIGGVCLDIALALGTARSSPGLAALFTYLGAINLLLAVFNLIPGFPLDGGRMLRSVIWHFNENLPAATRWAAGAGRVAAWLMIGFGVWRLTAGDLSGVWRVLIGWYLHTAAQGAYQQLILRRSLAGVRVSQVMTASPPTVDAALRVDQFVRLWADGRGGAYPVTQEGRFLGVVTLEDIQDLDCELWQTTAIEAITHAPGPGHTVDGDTEAWEALVQMLEHETPRMWVLAGGELRGSVSRESLLQFGRSEAPLAAPAHNAG